MHMFLSSKSKHFQQELKNKLIAVILMPLLAISLFSISGCSKKSDEQTKELKKITFVLDYTPNTNHLGLYVAKNKGYFKEAGFEVEIQQPPDSGADALVASGKAQFGISFQDWMANYLGSDSPLPVTAIAAITQHNTSSILSKSDSGIKTPKDLSGKTYGSMGVDSELSILKSLVNEDGGNFDSVNIVENNAVDEMQGLNSGLFDCVWSYDAWGVLMCKLNGMDVNTISIASLNETFDYYTPVIIANNDYINSNPDETKSFLSAIKKGYEFAYKNPEEAAQILFSEDKTLDENLVKASSVEIAKSFIDDTNFEEGASNWGKFDENRWAKFYIWMNEQDLTKKPLDPTSGFTNAYL